MHWTYSATCAHTIYFPNQRLLPTACRAWDGVNKVNILGIALLIVEGALCCGIATVWIWNLLQAVASARYRLFSVFLVIPTGLLRALASKQIQVNAAHVTVVTASKRTTYTIIWCCQQIKCSVSLTC